MTVLSVQGLGKRYKHYFHRWGRLVDWCSGGRYVGYNEHWALRRVSFELAPGEVLGVIGLNGAGKSTLLKILAGVTQQTTGTWQANGRLAALLELGLGFQPDLTGRQNAVLGCQTLGISGPDLTHYVQEVESFAELGGYIDRPLRTYSTGMQMRLAFSAATIVRPDILLIDEALMVGDQYFQHKAMQRMRSIIKEGAALILVSHDPSAIKSLCDRALLLDEGIVIKAGRPEDVLNYYNAMVAQREADVSIEPPSEGADKSTSRWGSKQAEIQTIDLQKNAVSSRVIESGDPVTITVDLKILKEIDELTVGFLIRDRIGNDIFGTNTKLLGVNRTSPIVGSTLGVRFMISGLSLGPGSYSLSVALHGGLSHLDKCYDWWDRATTFKVTPMLQPKFGGVCGFPVSAQWTNTG